MKENTQKIRDALDRLFKDETDTERVMALGSITQSLDEIDKSESELTDKIIKSNATIRDLILHGTTGREETPTPEDSPSPQNTSFGDYADRLHAK